jgi:uncharacterized protein
MSVAEVYGRWMSPLLHSISGASGACRFQPTCSEYAMIAVAHHGMVRGTVLAAWRLLRCNPFCRGGFDPVPGMDFRPSTADAPALPHR